MLLVVSCLDCNTLVFSIKTLERSVREKKSANTSDMERTLASPAHLSPVSLVFFTLAPDL